MKPLKTKAQMRAELEQQIQDYLAQGGKVSDIPRGLSGHSDNTHRFAQITSNSPPQERTPLDDVVKALDSRKQGKHKTLPRNVRPRKRLITDDFGEPIRWVWVEE